MAQKIKRKQAVQKKRLISPFNIYWNKQNYFFLLLGFILLIIGYYVMSLGSWDSTESLILSPIILVIAYVLIFPLSIFSRKKEPTAEIKEDKS